MLMFGLRLGRHPQVCVTTTPKPVRSVRELLADPTCTVTRGATMSNARYKFRGVEQSGPGPLAETFLRQILGRYEGTRLYRQEVLGEYLAEAEGALWARDQLDRDRILEKPTRLARIVVAVDPAASSDFDSDETGIVVAGIDRQDPPHGYLLEDLSGRYSPDAWAKVAIDAYYRHKADRLIAEHNNGGEMVEATIRTVDPNVSYREVWASRSKEARAEPVSALCEQARIHHVGGFMALEDQLAGWEPRSGQRSPDRLDAYVWAFTELMLGAGIGWDDLYPDERKRPALRVAQ
jgi:phage terminase large subunit-like protein